MRRAFSTRAMVTLWPFVRRDWPSGDSGRSSGGPGCFTGLDAQLLRCGGVHPAALPSPGVCHRLHRDHLCLGIGSECADPVVGRRSSKNRHPFCREARDRRDWQQRTGGVLAGLLGWLSDHQGAVSPCPLMRRGWPTQPRVRLSRRAGCGDPMKPAPGHTAGRCLPRRP